MSKNKRSFTIHAFYQFTLVKYIHGCPRFFAEFPHRVNQIFFRYHSYNIRRISYWLTFISPLSDLLQPINTVRMFLLSQMSFNNPYGLLVYIQGVTRTNKNDIYLLFIRLRLGFRITDNMSRVLSNTINNLIKFLMKLLILINNFSFVLIWNSS